MQRIDTGGNKVGANLESLSSFIAQMPLYVLMTDEVNFSNSVKGHRKAQYWRYVHSTPHLSLNEKLSHLAARNITPCKTVVVIVIVRVTTTSFVFTLLSNPPQYQHPRCPKPR
jgi:hypothetical protein